MNLKVIIITSIAASTWGANNPEFTWLDMERVLYESRLFPYRSVAATMGGVQDLALNLTDDGRRKILSAAQRNNIPLAEHRELSDEIDARMSVYQNKAGDTPIAAYINVGGGISAIGSLLGKKHFNAGLNQAIAPGALKIDSVMSRFAKSHTPVIFMINIRRLAKQYGLPVAPRKMQKAGEGAVFMKLEYNRPLIIGLLFLLGFIMLLFVRMGIGYRLFAPLKIKEKIEPPKHMV
jgi:poly-gamma-glutamate system protein